jgi:hypothetical protein
VTGEESHREPTDLRRRAIELLEHNLARVETTPRRPIDPNLVRTEADQAVVNVSAAFETLDALGLVTEADRERFFRRLREITSTAYAPFRGVELERVVKGPPAREVAGLHLLGAELYRDGVLLRWLFVSPPSDPDRGGHREHRPPEASRCGTTRGPPTHLRAAAGSRATISGATLRSSPPCRSRRPASTSRPAASATSSHCDAVSERTGRRMSPPEAALCLPDKCGSPIRA